MYRLLQATSIVTMCILVCLTRLCSANITAHQLLPTTTTSTPKFPKQNVVKVPTPPPPPTHSPSLKEHFIEILRVFSDNAALSHQVK